MLYPASVHAPLCVFGIRHAQHMCVPPNPVSCCLSAMILDSLQRYWAAAKEGDGATACSGGCPKTLPTIWRPSSSPAASSGTLMQRGFSALHMHVRHSRHCSIPVNGPPFNAI